MFSDPVNNNSKIALRLKGKEVKTFKEYTCSESTSEEKQKLQTVLEFYIQNGPQ